MNSNRKDLVFFFLIAFAWTWVTNLPRLLSAFGWIDLSGFISTLLGYVAILGPGVAAFLLTGIRSGRQGLKSLWRRGWDLNFPRVWLIAAIFLIPVTALLSFLILQWLDSPIAWEYGLPPAMIVPIGLIIWLFAYPEEYGWRGYALPRLLKNFNPLAASLILGFLWGIWHLPLHFIPGTTQVNIPVWEYLLQTIVLAVLYTWLHRGTRGSVFIASLFHAMGNITGAVFPYWTTSSGRYISLLTLLVPAGWVIVRWLSRQSSQEKD